MIDNKKDIYDQIQDPPRQKNNKKGRKPAPIHP